ncbi:hypothetical protein HOY80DRAFT_1006351 [Tuber brumale]|nr:hypothetical protein HOY80DRAFT_1006351 [Tuber brumale]
MGTAVIKKGPQLCARVPVQVPPTCISNPKLVIQENLPEPEKDSFHHKFRSFVAIKQTSPIQRSGEKQRKVSGCPIIIEFVLCAQISCTLLPPLHVHTHTLKPSWDTSFLFSQRIALLAAVIDRKACGMSIAHYEIHKCRRYYSPIDWLITYAPPVDPLPFPWLFERWDVVFGSLPHRFRKLAEPVKNGQTFLALCHAFFHKPLGYHWVGNID